MSIRGQMQDRAVAMAEAMADRARTADQITAARQHLVAQIQSEALQPYIGIPLVQELTKRLAEAQRNDTQIALGGAPQGSDVPVAEEVMAQAQQGAGVEALPSNLPQSYAPGGLVAFEEGGQVERYQVGGNLMSSEVNPYGMTEYELILDELRRSKPDQFRRLGMANDPRLLGATPPTETVGMEAERARNMALVNAPVVTPTPTPAAAQPAAPSIGMPNLALPKVTLPAMPTATDFTSFTKNLPTEAKAAFNTARDAEEKYLRGLTEPGEKAREQRFSAREAALAKDSAMGRALNLMSLGFGIAGSKERTLAGAMSKEGREGIAALIQGEAANRVAKERLEDAQDNFEQQKIANRKGDRAAATAAGQRAADDLRAYTGLNLQAAQAGSSEAMQRAQMQQSGTLGVAQLEQQGVLGVAQLRQQAATANAQLQLGRERLNIIQQQIAAGDKRAAAALAGAQQKAYAAFQSDPQTRTLMVQLQKKYGDTFMQNPQAQMQIEQARRMYMMNAIPSLLGSDAGGTSIKDVAELLKE